MTNKEFRELLTKYPDSMEVCVRNGGFISPITEAKVHSAVRRVYETPVKKIVTFTDPKIGDNGEEVLCLDVKQ